jgi:uncharacterized protein YybS (DUF2232 family)
MRGLAEYAMSGRRQAILVAVLFGLIPPLYPLSGAVVALVVLRRGVQEGLVVLLWALLAAGLHWVAGNTSPALVLVGVTALAWLLRSTQSWQKVLLAATVLGLALQFSLPLQPEVSASFTQIIEAMHKEAAAAGQPWQIPEVTPDGTVVEVDVTPEQVVMFLMSFYGTVHTLMMIGALMVARASQARLYNPGGFRQEFHNLRLDPLVMLALFGLVVAGVAGVSPLAELTSLFCVIPIVVGLAVIHAAVASLKLGVIWLFITYAVLVFMSPVTMPMVILLGFTDSIFDFRRRLKNNSDLPKD